MKRQIVNIFFPIYICPQLTQNNCTVVKKTRDNGKHNAFISATKFKDTFYCSLREGDGHIFDFSGEDEEKERILRSTGSENCKSVNHIKKEYHNLRAPPLSITPDYRHLVFIWVSIWGKTDRKNSLCLVQ